MRQRVVLDASAAVRIVVGHSQTADLLNRLAETEFVLAPTLYSSEVANALWKYVTYDDMTRESAVRCLSEARHLVDHQVEIDELAEESLVAAATFGHPVYDMLYAVLARRHGAPLLTVDRRMVAVLERMGLEALPVNGTLNS